MSLPGRPVCGKLGRQDVKAGDSSLSVQRRLAKKKKSQLFVYTRRQSRTTSGWQVWGAGSRSEELQERLCSPVTHPVGEPECEGSLPTPRSL